MYGDELLDTGAGAFIARLGFCAVTHVRAEIKAHGLLAGERIGRRYNTLASLDQLVTEQCSEGGRHREERGRARGRSELPVQQAVQCSGSEARK